MHTCAAMFIAVSRNFLKLILWYSLLLIGFALSFSLIFHQDVAAGLDEPSNMIQMAFVDFPTYLLKVGVMATGELAYEELPFDAAPKISWVIFIAFLFFITIVLMNLLVGSAVSDIEEINSKVIKRGAWLLYSDAFQFNTRG